MYQARSTLVQWRIESFSANQDCQRREDPQGIVGQTAVGIFSPQFLFCLIPLCQVRRCKTDPITLKLCRKTGGNTRVYSQKNPIRYERVGISVILVYKLKGQRANKLIYDIKESYFKDSAFNSSQSKGMHLAIEGMRKGYLLQSGSRQFWKMR